MCQLILRFSHTAEYMAIQADIANAEAQRVREAVKTRPSKKDLRHLGKGNLAGVMTGEGILDVMQEFFCFESCIYNPLHAARRAMAAAVPLPHKGAATGFSKGIPIFLPRTSSRSYSEVSLISFSPYPPNEESAPRKDKGKNTF